MQTDFKLTTKQAEYIRNAHHRWNVACGAVRSGKSYCQISYCIPSRLIERKNLRGLRVILGATRSNIERNILQPMRDIYGDAMVSTINSQNYAKIFGEKVYCIGADNTRQVAKIRGSEIAYCAVDEAIDINPEVFEMLKSRLSLPWSCCDITTNPSSPSHWFKQFLESASRGVDIYLQEYTIYDNPFLPSDYVKALENEYRGTVWFDRYIRGLWTQAEGLIYPMYKDALTDSIPDYFDEYGLGIDYGTQNAFAALLFGRKANEWYVIDEYYYSGRDSGHQKTDEDYKNDIVNFVSGLPSKVFEDGITCILDPSAASFKAALHEVFVDPEVSRQVYPVRMFRLMDAKNDVLNGIKNTARCLQKSIVKIYKDKCPCLIKEFGGYVWAKDGEDRPVKVNDHAMDALRYFVNTKRLLRYENYEEYKSLF